jgi:hypothetical protein
LPGSLHGSQILGYKFGRKTSLRNIQTFNDISCFRWSSTLVYL